MSPANGGWDCWIILQDSNQNYSVRQASPGDVINWQALNMPCAPDFYTSDQATVPSEATLLASSNSGSWQTAEQLTSGGGSGG